MLSDELSRLSLKDLHLLVQISKVGSLREVARDHQMEVAQLSRAIKRIESQFGKSLFSRSTKGLGVTAYGSEIIEKVMKALEWIEQIERPIENNGKKWNIDLKGVGAPPYLAQFLVSPLISQLYKEQQITNVDVAELPPDRLVLSGLRGHIELAFHAGPLSWPQVWITEKIGKMKWKLYGSKKQFQGSKKDFKELPYVYPIFWSPEGLRSGNDLFPSSSLSRMKAIGVTSAIGAIQVLKNSASVAYLPEIVVQKLNDTDIEEIKHPELPVTSEDIYISFRSDLIKKKAYDLIYNKAVNLIRVD